MKWNSPLPNHTYSKYLTASRTVTQCSYQTQSCPETPFYLGLKLMRPAFSFLPSLLCVVVVSVWVPINAISLSFNISWYTMPIHWAWVIYSLIPRPFLVGGVRKERGRKGLVKKLNPVEKGEKLPSSPLSHPTH